MDQDKKHQQDEENARNRPTEEGRSNDPFIRDESAIQPGVQTVSGSDFDDENQQVTGSAMTDGTLSEFDTDTDADPSFDEVDKRDDL